MEIEEYFELFTKKFNEANAAASAARAKGYDPETFVEIKAAPDIGSRVEGLIGLEGIAELIKSKGESKPRQELAFEMAKEICTNSRFEMETAKRITLAVRVGLAMLTDAVLVAPTEGMQGVELHKNQDGTTYIAVLYAGPIRAAGGTAAALSVALADLSRKILGVGAYKATQTEVERTIEEMLIYDARCARLQYKPSEEDMRFLLENFPVCVDGVPTEQIEVGIHRNIKRLDENGKEQMLTNKIRGGVALVVCEGVAQKAKSVLKNTKAVGLDWSWLNNVIKVDKGTSPSPVKQKDDKKEAVFLQELIAGRPVLAYPSHAGSFRLRYGRSRMTGIAAKGFSPATMYILKEFIAIGTQVRVEKPGKGCIATPVDSIEGPFVKLNSGEALRINSAEQAKAVLGQIKKIISVGDILVTYGDFRKSNTPLAPTSYVEEYWAEQLRAAGYSERIDGIPSFSAAYKLSRDFKVPMHPRYIYEYSDVRGAELFEIANAVLRADVENSDGEKDVFATAGIEIPVSAKESVVRDAIERLCIPHLDNGTSILVRGDDAQSLLVSLGFSTGERLNLDAGVLDSYVVTKSALEIVNSVSPFKVMKRSTRIGARIGRPEKARERLMKPAPQVLFPIGDYGSKDRNIYKSYVDDKRKFGTRLAEIEVARYRCMIGRELQMFPYCRRHASRAIVERICKNCGRITSKDMCSVCNIKTNGFDTEKVSLSKVIDDALKNVGVQSLPKVVKGVRGLVSRDKIPEPLEKGILRAMHNLFIFKDGTARFDATDAPMTHFYPKEMGVSVEKLRELGYTHDYLGQELKSGDQLIEMRHQDVVINERGARYMLNVAKFIDDLLVKFYKLEPFYNIETMDQIIGHFVISLSPHTSCGVLGRIVGVTGAHVGFAHPYTITARRRNCDGDEDTTMLLLDALINFSKRYLPTTIGGTMDAPIILTLNVHPDDVDDEVHMMETLNSYGLEFYEKTFSMPPPGDVQVEIVMNRLKKREAYQDINFTHGAGADSLNGSPAQSVYTKLKSMQEKIDVQFELMDRLFTIDRADAARRLIISHFIPDLIGNMHSFSKQTFRCVACNAKYRRVPLVGKCTRCDGKLVLTISKGGIEKYLQMATDLADRYNLEPYIKQRLMLVREEIETVFGGVGGGERPTKQFNLANYM